MNEPLRPSSLGEILDRTAQLYRSRFLIFLGISALPIAVVVVLVCVAGLVAAWWGAAGAHSVSSETGYALVGFFFIGLTLLALPLLLVVSGLAAAAMSHAVACIHLGGTTTIRDAYKSVWRLGWRYIWLYLLQRLIVWVAPLAVWIALALLAAGATVLAQKGGMGASADTIFGSAAFLVVIPLAGYGIWMLLQLSLAFPACVVEQIGAWRAVKRSIALSQETKGRILLLYLLAGALGWILSIAVTVPLAILVSLIPGIDSPPYVQTAEVAMPLIVYGSAFAVQAMVEPIYGIALVLFYYDQRIRKEGYDIELLMQQAGMAPAAKAEQPVPEAAPWLSAVPRLAPAVATESSQAAEPPQFTQSTSESTGETQ
jgi:hypothetical protein